jgi:hypothetical protein
MLRHVDWERVADVSKYCSAIIFGASLGPRSFETPETIYRLTRRKRTKTTTFSSTAVKAWKVARSLLTFAPYITSLMVKPLGVSVARQVQYDLRGTAFTAARHPAWLQYNFQLIMRWAISFMNVIIQYSSVFGHNFKSLFWGIYLETIYVCYITTSDSLLLYSVLDVKRKIKGKKTLLFKS